MFDHKHYVPVLRWRPSEKEAIKKLDENAKNRMTPLIELLPFSTDPVERLREAAQDIHQYWVDPNLFNTKQEKRVFLDLCLIDPDLRSTNGAHPISIISSSASGLNLIIVTGLDRSPAYQLAVKSIAKRHGLGIRTYMG